MSKYEKNSTKPVEIKDIIVEGEKILWSGKPKKSAFVFNKTMTMFPVALIWLLFDGFFIAMLIISGDVGPGWWFIIPFFALHLMPVWIWLSNLLTANKRWQNTRYALTNKRIIISSGFIGVDYETVFYKEIKHVRLNVGFLDKLLKVGDIFFELENGSADFLDIEDCYELYPKLQKVVLDIQTDIEFPNKLRPKTNDGFETEYTAKF